MLLQLNGKKNEELSYCFLFPTACLNSLGTSINLILLLVCGRNQLFRLFRTVWRIKAHAANPPQTVFVIVNCLPTVSRFKILAYVEIAIEFLQQIFLSKNKREWSPIDFLVYSLTKVSFRPPAHENCGTVLKVPRFIYTALIDHANTKRQQ